MFRIALTILLIFLPFVFNAQEIEPPQISMDSGFYEEGFEVSISHEDPSLIILYTLDGSEPTIENLEGKEWNYKTYYPIYPGDDFGELLQDTIWTYEYSAPLIIEDRTPTETVLTEVYTAGNKQGVYAQGEVFKSNILRARAYSEETGEYSEIIGRNYFITEEGTERYTFPVVAISLDNDRFYSYEEGISVPGIIFDEYREEYPDLGFHGWEPGNYRLSGKETEIPIHFNYFENGEEVLNHNAGVRINGGYTRSFANKSLRLYAKSDYGEKNFKHAFFEGYDVDKFKRLILRNSGNDGSRSFFRDAFMHQMAKNLNFEIQESLPVVVFINGEYNGIRNLRERYDSKYFDKILGVPEDSLDFLENYLEVKEGDDVFYNEMMEFFENNSLEEAETYQQAITFLDPINFTDYYATYIYVANDDWPQNNYLFWRYKTDYDPEAEPSHKDGRFRWLLKDLDRGFHLHNNAQNGPEGNTLAWATRENEESTLLMRKLLENQEFKEYFITRFADLMNTTFLDSRVVSIIEDFETRYQPEIPENSRRWRNETAKLSTWLSVVNRIKNFAEERASNQREHLVEKFDLDGTLELILNVSSEEEGYIHLNTIDILPTTDGAGESPYPWIGEYFQNLPITLKAIPNEGYIFSHWSGAIESTDPEITISVDEDTYLKANFIDEDMGLDLPQKYSLQLYPNPTNGILNLKSNADWELYVIYDVQGRQVKSGKISENHIDLENLDSGIYFLHLQTNEGEKTQRKIIKN